MDMFREMFCAAMLGKLSTMDASALPAMQVLRMATINGAKALGTLFVDAPFPLHFCLVSRT